MKHATRLTILGSLLGLLVLGPGCESTDQGSSVSGSTYYGAGSWDPWYYGDYHDDVVVVRPPSDWNPGARPEHPIANPPSSSPGLGARPMPAMPSAPRPSFRR